MNILFFTRRFWPEIGGVEKHCLEVGKRLVEKGHGVTLITEVNPNDQFSMTNFQLHEEYESIGIFRIPITASEKLKKFQIWKWLWKNRNLIKEAEVVHYHDVFYWYLPFRFLYPRKKVFVTFHGYEGSQPPNKRKIFMHRLAAKLSNGCIAIGDWHEKWYGVKADFVSYGAVETSMLEQGGEPVPPARWKYRFRVKPGMTRERYAFCFVGRLAEDTGIMTYLETMRILKEKKKTSRQARSISLVICGDGQQKEEAKEFVKKHRLNARFEGFVEDVEKYLNQSKFVFVSRYLGILEAMAAKKLVFAVYDNAIKEDYLKMAPFASMIIIENNLKNLAEKIEYYINHKKKADELIKKGYNWSRKQSWGKMTETYLKLWRK